MRPSGRLHAVVRERLGTVVRKELARRDAAALVHVGPIRDPAIRYCRPTAVDGSETNPDAEFQFAAGARRPIADGTPADGIRRSIADGDRRPRSADAGEIRAIAHDGDDVLVCGPEGDGHPAERLAERLLDRGVSGRLLAPPSIPHDAALHLAEAGNEIASTAAVDRARAAKTGAERAAIDRAQRAAAAGVRRAAARLVDARDAELPTGEELRRAACEGVAAAGGHPTPRTRVVAAGDAAGSPSDGGAGSASHGTDGSASRDTDGRTSRDSFGSDELRRGAPVGIRVAARDRTGYRGRLDRTFVVDGDGGRERRAHVAATRALESVRALAAAPDPTVGGETPTVGSMEAELAAELRAYGFDDVDATVAGVGLDSRERPVGPDDAVESGAVISVEAAIRGDGGAVRVGDVLVRSPGDDSDASGWLAGPSRSLDPATVAETD